ncbi:hypothetical protein HZS_1714 [Henneguya salminicola]|nr:hypothetical protein HZS_1714 [Henneguya salminicola]
MFLTHSAFVLYRTFYSGQDKIDNQLKFRMYLISFLSHSNKNINESTTNEKNCSNGISDPFSARNRQYTIATNFHYKSISKI